MEEYSQSSDESDLSYYTWKSKASSDDADKCLLSMEHLDTPSLKEIPQIQWKSNRNVSQWDDFDVSSFEEHKCVSWISIPDSVVNYRE